MLCVILCFHFATNSKQTRQAHIFSKISSLNPDHISSHISKMYVCLASLLSQELGRYFRYVKFSEDFPKIRCYGLPSFIIIANNNREVRRPEEITLSHVSTPCRKIGSNTYYPLSGRKGKQFCLRRTITISYLEVGIQYFMSAPANGDSGVQKGITTEIFVTFVEMKRIGRVHRNSGLFADCQYNNIRY